MRMTRFQEKLPMKLVNFKQYTEGMMPKGEQK